ncbi:BRD4-interacting chromatin-remodeling complex-associated protein-like isoform X2 [Acanthaster planci]|uniref:BRD4-interacting chromatin-remodeling complex-associated protein-like isoform X2 n=1 Tax=Acanthaster planci TaxID=133434 RepID=A0A8B7ZK87_ACAPL|nr:BRD4-interacting chromatin-remodeling complex-associated protein-like isoform X2 [Acanthaster planci]
MDDGRCLLDVIGDPIALDEFLQNEDRQLQPNLYSEVTDDEQINYPSSHQLLSPTDLILPQSDPQPSYLQTSLATSDTLDAQAVSSTTHGDEFVGKASPAQQNAAGSDAYNPQAQFVQVQQSTQVHAVPSSASSNTAIPVATIKPYAETPALQVLNGGTSVAGGVEDSAAQVPVQLGQTASQVQEQPAKAAPTAQTPGGTLHYLAPGSTIIARNAAGQPVTLSGTMLQAVQSMTQSLGPSQAVGQPIQIIPSNQLLQQGGALAPGRVMALSQVIIGGAPGQQITLVQAPPKATPKVSGMQTIIASPQVVKGPANIQPKPAGGTVAKTPISIRPVQTITIPTQALQAGAVPQNYQIITHPTLGPSVMVSTASQDQTQQPQVVSQLLQPAASSQQENNNSSSQQQSYRLVPHQTSGQILQIPTQAVQQGNSSGQQQQQQSYRIVQQQSTGQPFQVASAQQDSSTPVQQTYQIVNQPVTGQGNTLTKTLAHQQGTGTSQPGIVVPQQAVVLQNQTVLSNYGTTQKVHPVITIGTSQGNIIVMTQAQPVASTTTTQSGVGVAPELATGESQAEPANSKAKKSSRPSKKKKTTADIAPKTGVAERASPLQTPAQAIQRVPTHQSPATVVLQTDFTITPNAQGIPTMTISKAGSHPTSAQTTQLSVTPQVTQSTYQVSSVSVQQKQPDAKAQALLDADQQQFQLYQKVLKLQQAQQQQHQQQAGQQLQQAGQPGGPTSHGAQQAIQQALRLSQQQAQLSAQQAQLKAQLSLQQVQPAQQILQAAPGQLAQQDQQQQQQQGTLTVSQQQAQQTVEQVLQSSQMAYTSQQQLLSLNSQGLQSQTSSSQPPLSQPQMAQSSQPTADQQTPLAQQQQQQSKPGTRQMTIGQALLALINQSGKGQQITSQQQLQQFIQANPHFLKQLQMTLQQQKQQQQLQLQQQSQSAQPQAASSQPGDLQASSAQQSQGTPQLASANSNSDKSATQVQPSLEQGLQVLPQTRVTAVSQQQAVSSQVPHTFGGLGSAAIHLARLRQQKQQQQQQQSSALPVDQQGANGGTSPQQAVAQSQLQQQISQGATGQQAGLAQAKQSPLLGQLTSVVQTSQSLDQPSQGSLQIGQGNLFQMTSQNVAAAPAAQVTVQQQLQQQRQLSASSAVVQVQQQSTSQIGADQLSQGGPAQVQVGTPASGLQVQTVQRAGDNATQQGVQVQYQGQQQQQQGLLVQQRVSQHQGMEVPPNVQLQAVHQQHSVQEQQQGMQQQQQGMLVQQQGVQMQQQPQGGEQGSSSGITQVSSQAPSGRQQVIQQISIQAQRQLQLVQSHIRQLGALASPTDQQKNMLAQLQSLQQKIVQQARQQLSQYLASGASQQQKPTSTSQATTGAAATLQSQGLSQSTPAFASAQKPAAGAGQVLSQSLNSKDALQQQQQQQQGAQQLASAVATAAAIQASLKGAAQAGNSTLTPKQRLLVRQLQEHLKKVTPEQQQQFYKMHQPLLLKIQAQARSSSSQPAVAPHPQQITQQQVSSSSPTKNIAIKPAIASKPVASKEPPKEILPKPEKEKHKHKSKHKDKDKERERDKEREKEREKEKDKLSKKPKPTPLAKQLAQDQASAEKADTKKPFTTASKAIKRLLPFHLCQDKTATDKQLALTDEIFETKCIGLMEKKQRMLDKYQLLLYNESMRLRPSAEVVMIERMFLSDERNKLEADKKLAAANKELLHSSTSISNTLTISGHPSTVNTTTTTTSLPAGSTSAKVKLGQKMDTPILRELVTSSSIPQNLLSPRIAAALTEVVATKMASTAHNPDREGGAMAKENGALESSSSESGDSLRNGSGDGPDSPRLPPKKRKVDMSAYLIEDSAGPNEGNIENHVKLKLKRKPAAEMMDPGREVPSARHLSDKIPGVSEVEISHPTNQRRLTPDRRPSFQDTFLKSIGIEEKAVSNTIMPVQEELRENKEVEEAPVQDEESDEKISVVDLQEQMECAINSILDLQRQEPVPKSPGLNCPKVLQDIAVVKPAIPQMKPQSPREVQELGSDGMNFDDQSALSDIDFESHTNSIEYDLGHIGDTFPFDTDDQTQFLPDRNTDIFHTDISSSSYPPAPTATAINASPVPEHVINEDTESSLYSSCGVEKQHPASESARNGYGNTNDDSPLLDESSVVAQFQSELSMLQHRQAEEEQVSEEEFFTGGTGTETAETDPDLEAAVNSILF